MSEKKVLLLGKYENISTELIRTLKEGGYPNLDFSVVEEYTEIPLRFEPDLTIIDVDSTSGIKQIPHNLINNGSRCIGITMKSEQEVSEHIGEDLARKLTIHRDIGDVFTSSDRILRSYKNNYGRVGIIGMGRIGEALLTQLIETEDRLGLKEVTIFYRPKEKERVTGVIDQLAPLNGRLPIHHTQSLYELGRNSGIIIIIIGRKEEGKKREDLTGQYFYNIKKIMDGIRDSESTIFMATNPVTPNCLVAHLYSQRENPNIVGFTRLDYIRAKRILKNWLEEKDNTQNDTSSDWESSDWKVELDVLGPHGYGLLVTNIRIGEKEGNHIYKDSDLRFLFEDFEGRIRRLSNETAEYGEKTYRSTLPNGTPGLFALQIVESLEYMLKGNRDIVAIDVNLGELCRSGLRLPRRPTYMSFPVIYHEGIPKIDSSLSIEKIPIDYRTDLLNTLIGEEKRIMDYLETHKNEFSKLREHFGLQ